MSSVSDYERFFSLSFPCFFSSLVKNSFEKYTSGHQYNPKKFSSAFMNEKKNTEPISVKDKRIGRPGTIAQSLVEEDDTDDEDDTFPQDTDLSNVAAMGGRPAAKAISSNGDNISSDEGSISSDEGSISSDEDSSFEEDTTGIDASEGEQEGATDTVAGKESKKRHRKIDAGAPRSENAAPRKINPTNMMGDIVASCHPIRAMRPGPLKTCLDYSIKESFPQLNNEDHSVLCNYILGVIRTLAKVHSDLLREGLLAADLYIAKVFKDYPSIEGDKAEEHAEQRKNLFQNLLLKGRRDSFFQRLLRRLISWGSAGSTLRKSNSPGATAADEVFEHYYNLTSQRQAPPFLSKDSDVCASSFLEQCARTLSDMVGGHFFKFTLELKKRVSNHSLTAFLRSLQTDADVTTLAADAHRYSYTTQLGLLLTTESGF
jgi:hypothetical protein